MTDEPESTATPHGVFYVVFGGAVALTGAVIVYIFLDPDHWMSGWSSRFTPPFDDALRTGWGKWFTPFAGQQAYGYLLITLGGAIAMRAAWAPHLGAMVALITILLLGVPILDDILETFGRAYDFESPIASALGGVYAVFGRLTRSGMRGLAAITVFLLSIALLTTVLVRPIGAAFRTNSAGKSMLLAVACCALIAGARLPDTVVLFVRFILLDTQGITYFVGDAFARHASFDSIPEREFDLTTTAYIYLRYSLWTIVYGAVAWLGWTLTLGNKKRFWIAVGVTLAYSGVVAMEAAVYYAWTPVIRVGLPGLVLPGEQFYVLPHLWPIYYFGAQDFALPLIMLIGITAAIWKRRPVSS